MKKRFKAGIVVRISTLFFGASLRLGLVCLALVASLAGCASATSSPADDGFVAQTWQPLLTRLQADGLASPEVRAALAALPQGPSQDPMGRKITELYKRAFVKPPPPPPPDPNAPKVPPKPRPRVYQGVVTPENVALCRNFLAANRAAFAEAQARYGVPPQIAVALLFVETRLGTFLGKERAFVTLASMAASREPWQISSYLAKLPDTQLESRDAWIRERMAQRSDWAYKELRALLVHNQLNGNHVLEMPGSIYGAIGLCQFMPSNIEPYGADGDNNGQIDLFTVPDAVASLANYLAKNGWKANAPRAARHKALKSYNRIDIYANTILALADAIVDTGADSGTAPNRPTGQVTGKAPKKGTK